MIIEIALGIVLAVLILSVLPVAVVLLMAALPYILGIAAILVVGILAYNGSPTVFALLSILGAFLSIAALAFGLSRFTRLDMDEGMAVIFLTGLIGLAVHSVLESYFKWGEWPETTTWVAALVIAEFAGLYALYRKVIRRPKKTGAPKNFSESEKAEWGRRQSLGYKTDGAPPDATDAADQRQVH